MEQQGSYRHELKYRIGMADYLILRQRLRPVMKTDSHTDENGLYQIHSLYFDNADDKALREKINGVSKREKFRIRYYNEDLSYISLEKKIKQNHLCLKLSAEITQEQYRALLTGEVEWMPSHPSELVRELYCKMNIQQLRPRVMVSYTREPYIYEAGNVRVTFDSDIRTSLFQRDFLGHDLQDIAVADQPGERILEVKYDAFLPQFLSELLETPHLNQQAFSKYGISRRFG